MYNWNDLKVEQEIAQERYQIIIEGRTIKTTGKQQASTVYDRFLHWLGHQLVTWGNHLQLRYDFTDREVRC